ncbi:MAG TPA: DUF4386 family protein, partial [Longilinea sp.]|nr:DUF4386 family protein [Longilinea sp.]
MIETRWKDLYKAAGIAAIVSEAVILSGLVTYFIWPYAPGNKTTEEIFTLLHNNLFGGLVSLDLFLLLGNVFSILIFLGLYVSLKPVNESYALFALALGLIGVVLLFPARPIFELVSLSAAYTAAASEAARSQYLAAGTALLSLFDGTGWIANTLLGGISLLISSLLMLRGGIYSKATAIVGIATNVATCCFFIPVIGTFLLFLSLPGLMAWYFLL